MRVIEKNDHRLFYDKNGVTVRDSIKADIGYLAMNLRQGDIDEIWASHHLRPMEAVSLCYKCSMTCLTGCINEVPFTIFGCTPIDEKNEEAMIWMLATEKIADTRMEFLRYSRYFVDILLKHYPLLFNYVDARNVRSIVWLKKIGAEVKEAKPYGVDQLPFHYFSFTRR